MELWLERSSLRAAVNGWNDYARGRFSQRITSGERLQYTVGLQRRRRRRIRVIVQGVEGGVHVHCERLKHSKSMLETWRICYRSSNAWLGGIGSLIGNFVEGLPPYVSFYPQDTFEDTITRELVLLQNRQRLRVGRRKALGLNRVPFP